MSNNTALVWFRNDLRLSDNPAFRAAVDSGLGVAAVYILDDGKPFAPGGAARWWLHHSLNSLAADLKKRGVDLTLRRGDELDCIESVASDLGAAAVYWNRRYDRQSIETDKKAKEKFKSADIAVTSFSGTLLREPWEVRTQQDNWYKVYTPFWKALQKMGPVRTEPLAAPRKVDRASHTVKSDKLEDWELRPTKPNWAAAFPDTWAPGADGAHERLSRFLEKAVDTYGDDRNRPDLEGTSGLSPHLAFGEISPVEIWSTTQSRIASGAVNEKEAMKFLSEIAWREFSYNLLYNFPDLPEKPLRDEFAHMPWANDEDQFDRWKKGLTGVPIVDAGMRQLWRDGWMHNRVRMIVASYLVKNLLIDWRKGERWFWDTLVDADAANNTASWQWVAGSGADAAPYFRIFNPVTQSEKFDPNGDYIRKYVPELSKLQTKHLHDPSAASIEDLKKAGVRLGVTYPLPLVDLKKTRQRALDAYDKIRN